MSSSFLTESLLRVAEGASLVVDGEGRDRLELGTTCIFPTDDEMAAIEAFAITRSLKSGVRAVSRRLSRRGPIDSLAVILQLLDRGVIEQASAKVRSHPRRGSGMYGCPIATVSEAVADGNADVIFLGMPYALGITGRPGAEQGPRFLRRCSRTAFDYVESEGRPTGWWHPERGERMLEGVGFRDAGDIDCGSTTRNGKAFDRLYQTALAIFRTGKVPVTIGGDHSISLPLITAAAAVNPGLGIVQFDAHGDIGDRSEMGNWRKNCTHGNFISWVVRNPDVSSVTQFGVRQLLPRRGAEHEKVSAYSGHQFIDTFERVLTSLPPDRPYYLTFDVDCLDTSLISQTGTLIPGGFSYRDAVDMLRGVATDREIVGIDFVEFAPREPHDGMYEGIVVAYLLFELLASAFQGRQKRKPVEKVRDVVTANHNPSSKLSGPLLEIPRLRTISRLDLTDFLCEAATPLLLTGATGDWPAMETWSFAYFAQHFGSFPVRAFAPQLEDLAQFGVETTIGAYVDYLGGGEIEGRWIRGDADSLRESGLTLYAGDFNPAHWRLGNPDLIFRAVPQQPEFVDCWLQLLEPEFVQRCLRRQSHHYVYLSAPGGITPLHHDFWETHAFLAQMSGRKRAVLFHPDDMNALYREKTGDVRKILRDPAYGSITGWSATLGPGDLLIIPSRWLHYTETLEPSITYSADWIDANNWRGYVEAATKALARRASI